MVLLIYISSSIARYNNEKKRKEKKKCYPFKVHPYVVVNLFRVCRRDVTPAYPCQEDHKEGLTSLSTHWHVLMTSSCLLSKALEAFRQICNVLCMSLSRSAYEFASLDSCYKRFGKSGCPLKMGAAGSCETLVSISETTVI